jgi:hypothetical protein
MLEGAAGHAEDGPVIERPGADPVIEVDGELIPVEHSPFEAAAVSLDCNASEGGKQRKADTLSARFGLDEQIFEIDPALSEKSGVAAEEKREPQRFVLDFRDDDFRGRPIGEERRAQLVLGCYARVPEALVCGEILNEFENERNVGSFRGPDLNRIRQNLEPR